MDKRLAEDGARPRKAGTIVVRLKGGLGNQLFQYAAAKALAAKHSKILKLDTTTGFQRDSYRRSYALHHFGLPEILL